jgi:hypothetical protein
MPRFIRSCGRWRLVRRGCRLGGRGSRLARPLHGFERRQAEETLRHSWPDAWEAIHGRKLKPGESHVRDGEAFARDHAEDWVVISAIYSDHQRGFTEVVRHAGRASGSPSRRAPLPCPLRGVQGRSASASSSMKRAMPSMTARRASSAGGAGQGGDDPTGGCLICGRAPPEAEVGRGSVTGRQVGGGLPPPVAE